MSSAFISLIVLVACAPFAALFAGPVFDGLITATVAATLVIIAAAMPPGEAKHQLKSIGVMLIFLAIPASWIALQAIPMPLQGVANPVWQSTGSALGTQLTGSMTVDPGRTMLAFVQYLTAVGLIVASSAICINRSRAEKILVALTAVTTLMALLLIAGSPLGLTAHSTTETLQGASALGVAVSAAALARDIERYATRGKFEISFWQFVRSESLYFAAHATCWIAIVAFAPTQVGFAAAFGFAIATMIVLIRVLGIWRWPIAALAGLALTVTLGLAAIEFPGEGDLTARYASAPVVDAATIGRIRTDTGWQGFGAGTFEALLPIYKAVDQYGASAPTTAADLAIELGTPALDLITVLALAAMVLFVRGALTRGRDACYPALGASSISVLLIESLVDNSAARTSVMIIAAAIAGLALAQIISRTVVRQLQTLAAMLPQADADRRP